MKEIKQSSCSFDLLSASQLSLMHWYADFSIYHLSLRRNTVVTPPHICLRKHSPPRLRGGVEIAKKKYFTFSFRTTIERITISFQTLIDDS